MDEWMCWMDGWINGWVGGGRMDEDLDIWMYEETDGWLDECAGWIDGWVVGWVDERMNR